MLGVQIVWENRQVILNCYTGPHADLKNLLILITKQYIYATKCLKEELNFIHLAQKIYLIQNLERIIASRNNKMFKHVRKWSTLA